jgi:hypothetical protein
MADQRALDAIRRVEQALARIESASSQSPPPAVASADLDEHRRLREAHDKLRRRVAGAIGEIDHMIEIGKRR